MEKKKYSTRQKLALTTAALSAAAITNTAGAQSTLSQLTETGTWDLSGVTGVVAAILVGVGVPVTIGFTAYRLGKRGANRV